MARRRKISVIERDLSVTEIINADEMFLTGTGTELVPVIEVEGRRIGSGAAGEITTALYADYMTMVATDGLPVAAA